MDIGGGTTGISILKDGEVVYIADEPTGGTHFSLVIAGAYGKPFQEAEVFKRDESNHKELAPVIKPVVDKVSSIISNQPIIPVRPLLSERLHHSAISPHSILHSSFT